MKSLLIIKTGRTVKSLLARGEDFEGWMIAAMDVSSDDVKVVSVYQYEALPELDTVSGMIITGSPAMITDGEDWNFTTMDYVREAVRREIPLLGICYGHQLLALAFGGKVDFHPAGREIGTVTINLTSNALEDPLFKDLPNTFPVQSSHSQSVIDLPAEAVLLACNDFESHHSFKLGSNAWSIQFHPEFSQSIMDEYIIERREILTEEGVDVDALLTQTRATPEATSVLKNFSALVQWD